MHVLFILAGSTYQVPSGVVWNASDISPRASAWSNPATGIVHMFHGDYWGWWGFSIESVDPKSRTIAFKEGG